MDTPQVLLEHYLKQLHLPSVLREYPKLSEPCAKEGTTFEVFLLRLVALEITDREQRAANVASAYSFQVGKVSTRFEPASKARNIKFVERFG